MAAKKKKRAKPIDPSLHPQQLRAIARKALNKATQALARAVRYHKEADKRELDAMDKKINPEWEREFCKACAAARAGGKPCLLHMVD